MASLNAKVKRCCEHYRERISECRNCDYEDAYYKECFLAKKKHKGNGHGTAEFDIYIKD